MSHLKNYSYEKQGVWNRDNYHYVQAVRLGDVIHLSGQGTSGTCLFSTLSRLLLTLNRGLGH